MRDPSTVQGKKNEKKQGIKKKGREGERRREGRIN